MTEPRQEDVRHLNGRRLRATRFADGRRPGSRSRLVKVHPCDPSAVFVECRLGLPLASRDAKQRTAAGGLGLTVLGA
jgi:hypothetical protein